MFRAVSLFLACFVVAVRCVPEDANQTSAGDGKALEAKIGDLEKRTDTLETSKENLTASLAGLESELEALKRRENGKQVTNATSGNQTKDSSVPKDVPVEVENVTITEHTDSETGIKNRTVVEVHTMAKPKKVENVERDKKNDTEVQINTLPASNVAMVSLPQNTLAVQNVTDKAKIEVITMDVENKTEGLDNKTHDSANQTAELQNEAEQIQRKIVELQSKVELQKKTEGLENKTTEVENKTLEIGNETEHLQNELAEIQSKVDLQNKTEELQHKTLDVGNQTAEIQNKTMDLQNKTIDVKNATNELQEKALDLGKKALEVQNVTVELLNKTVNLENKTLDLENKTTELQNKTVDLETKTTDLQNVTVALQNKTVDMQKNALDLQPIPGALPNLQSTAVPQHNAAVNQQIITLPQQNMTKTEQNATVDIQNMTLPQQRATVEQQTVPLPQKSAMVEQLNTTELQNKTSETLQSEIPGQQNKTEDPWEKFGHPIKLTNGRRDLKYSWSEFSEVTKSIPWTDYLRYGMSYNTWNPTSQGWHLSWYPCRHWSFNNSCTYYDPRGDRFSTILLADVIDMVLTNWTMTRYPLVKNSWDVCCGGEPFYLTRGRLAIWEMKHLGIEPVDPETRPERKLWDSNGKVDPQYQRRTRYRIPLAPNIRRFFFSPAYSNDLKIKPEYYGYAKGLIEWSKKRDSEESQVPWRRV